MITITDKLDGKKKLRRSYEDYEELPETQNPETTTEETEPTTETTTEETQPTTEPAAAEN